MLCPDCNVEMASGEENLLVNVQYVKCPKCNLKLYHKPDSLPVTLDGLKARSSVFRVTAYFGPDGILFSEPKVISNPSSFIHSSGSANVTSTMIGSGISGAGTTVVSGAVPSSSEACQMCGGRLVNNWCSRCGPLGLGAY